MTVNFKLLFEPDEHCNVNINKTNILHCNPSIIVRVRARIESRTMTQTN